ncbi:hypothetical protein [Terriglobus roseus]|uniref:Uncharacterized protein n=1 Tax=Terriglobus roseus TaxID=392734 RepID=A0A1H4N9J6_9BACT|nr:hypothetical protein [Terriglobus roseus]SEB91913.1 hypothetical protein SAMN05443244_2181 [Terriglobus roseus]
MSKLNLYQLKQSSFRHLFPTNDPDEQRRDELCMQLAENLHDTGVSDFSRELRTGNARFILRIVRE